jgi:fluoride exporter
MIWLAAGIGGAIGSIARHAVTVAAQRLAGRATPEATAVVNIAGCLIIGVLAGLLSTGALRLSEHTRVFVLVGLLGGFTTFSSFGLDTLMLARNGAVGLALVNVGTQVILGLTSVFAGFWIAKSI